jgi:hypothetical protein
LGQYLSATLSNVQINFKLLDMAFLPLKKKNLLPLWKDDRLLWLQALNQVSTQFMKT